MNSRKHTPLRGLAWIVALATRLTAEAKIDYLADSKSKEVMEG